MTMKPRLIALVAAACLACDDDDERPRYRADVEVEVSSPVSSLGERDRERICRSFDAYVDTYVSFDEVAYITCLPAAIVLGGDERGCEQLLDDCMENFPEPVAVQARLRDSEICYASLDDCRASVEELEGCINVNLDLALDIVDWSCSGAEDDDLREQAARAQDTAQVCADVDAPCRDFATIAGPD
jgi:hypothetical protein